jgi:putative redox protein
MVSKYPDSIDRKNKEEQMAVQTRLKWTEGFQFVARAGKGPAIILDSSDGGSGPTPMEALLMGVAGCTGIDVVMIMQKKRVTLTDFQINITGEQSEEYPRRYTRIQIEYVLSGKGIKPKAVEQAIKLSETKYCSALASLNAAYEHTYRIIDED